MSMQTKQNVGIAVPIAPSTTAAKDWSDIPSPLLNRVMNFLWKKEGSLDLNNLRQVNSHFKKAVEEYMSEERRTPQIIHAYFKKERIQGEKYLWIDVAINPLHVPYTKIHEMNLDQIQLKRRAKFLWIYYKQKLHKKMETSQFVEILGCCPVIQEMTLEVYGIVDLEPIKKILTSFHCHSLSFECGGYVDNELARVIKEMVAMTQSKEVDVHCAKSFKITDPSVFVVEIDQMCPYGVCLSQSSTEKMGLGLKMTFWRAFFGEVVRSGGRAFCGSDEVFHPFFTMTGGDMRLRRIQWFDAKHAEHHS